MNPIAQEAIRELASLAGAAIFTVMEISAGRPPKSYRDWLITPLPGICVGIFLAPELCMAVAAHTNVSWLECGVLHTDCAVALVTSLFGYTLCRALLLSAERLLPEWIWGAIKRSLGIPDSPPNPPRLLPRPDSDPPGIH
jgi:hypothetical protein